jgi:hypothetical protein
LVSCGTVWVLAVVVVVVDSGVRGETVVSAGVFEATGDSVNWRDVVLKAAAACLFDRCRGSPRAAAVTRNRVAYIVGWGLRCGSTASDRNPEVNVDCQSRQFLAGASEVWAAPADSRAVATCNFRCISNCACPAGPSRTL